MKKITVACTALIGLILVFASVASASKPVDHQQGGKSAAAKACATEKKADKAAFNATYGKHAMRNCIKAVVESGGNVVAAKNAAQECKAERAADPAGFQEQYGSNANGKNAFGKCVSSKADDSADDGDSDDTGDDDGAEELPVA